MYRSTNDLLPTQILPDQIGTSPCKLLRTICSNVTIHSTQSPDGAESFASFNCAVTATVTALVSQCRSQHAVARHLVQCRNTVCMQWTVATHGYTRYAERMFIEVVRQSLGLRPQLSSQDSNSQVVRFAAFVSKSCLGNCNDPID